jgi:flagellar motor switch/type III secretory pathway protein FliN
MMNSAKSFLATTAMAVLVASATVSCRTQSAAVQKGSGTAAATTASGETMKVLHKVADNAQYAQFITSKMKFKVTLGDKEVSLGGNLRMKRDDVIRLQLTAFGLIEAGRMEFTKDYVLVMDRINKQYIKVNYEDVDFLRQSGLNFYSLQALFWNELFLPNQQRVGDESLKAFSVSLNGTTTNISLDSGKLRYVWSAGKDNGLITAFDGAYSDSATGRISLGWTYGSFGKMGAKQFPSANTITLTLPKKTVTIDLQLTSINNDSDWETRTEVTSKYKKVSLDDILSRLSAL